MVVGRAIYARRPVEDASAPRTNCTCRSACRSQVKLQSNDVIHSLWIPNLAGKQDLIPGRVTDIQLLPQQDRPVTAGSAPNSAGCSTPTWRSTSRSRAAATSTVGRRAAARRLRAAEPVELAGYRFFTTAQLRTCHAIAGTPASATVGPDLTHVASRRSIAAGTLPMSEGNLCGWIADPQERSPATTCRRSASMPDELRAVVAYLEPLK